MAVVTKVRRMVNPRRKKKRKNPRRRLTAKQIRFFGTKRQKAALKQRKRRTTPRPAKRTAVNPRRKVRARRRNAPVRRKRQSNPALLVTLGAVNPRRNAVAKKRRKKKATQNPRRSRRNATRVVVTAPRRNRRPTRRRVTNRKRNPQLFGARVTGTKMATAVAAGLAGVAAAKFIPGLIPAQFIQGNLMKTVATGASAFVAQMIAKAVTKDQAISDAVLFGGLMQTGSAALNAFLPGIAAQFGLTGLGEIVDADWKIPENYLRRGPVSIAPAANARLNMAGIERSFGRSM